MKVNSLPFLFECLAAPLHHRLDPELLRSVARRPIEEDEGTVTELLAKRAGVLGLRIVPLSLSVGAILQLQGHELPVVVERPGQGPLLVREVRARRIAVWTEDSESRWLSAREFQQETGAASDSEKLSCAGAELALPLTHGGEGDSDDAHGHHGHGGLERLLSLMRLEREDLLSVLVYASFIGLTALAVPVAVQAVVNTVVFGALVQPLLILTLLVLACLAFNGLMRALQARVVERLQERLFVRAATEFAYRLPRIKVDAFDRVHAPEKVNRFFDVITAQKAVSSLLLDGSLLVLQAIVGMVLLAFYHPFLLAFDFVLIIAVGTIVWGMGRKAVPTSLEESAAKYELVAWLEDVARSPIAFRMNQEAALERADDLASRYLAMRREHFAIVFRQIVGAVVLQAVASASLLAIGGLLVLEGQLTVGQLVAAELVVTSVVAGVAKLGKHLESFYDLRTSLEKIGSVTDLPLEGEGATRSLPFSGPAKLDLTSVRFAHAGRAPVFDDLSLSVDAGERVAVFGNHGAGKSALADIIFGLRTVARGSILVDGVDVRELGLNELRRHVALVRDVEIFEGTLYDNVALWRPNVSPSDVHAALAAVGLSDAVARLPNGVSTRLLAGGNPLSLGQAQRLMLARVLSGKPRLLVIDGLLDGLEEGSLHDLEACLQTVCNGRTTLLVLTGLESVASFCDRRKAIGQRGTATLPPKELR